jgi:hypothetical protein
MKGTLSTASVVITITAIIFLSCQKELSCEVCNTGNKPPVAVAGPDLFISLPADSAFLNGSASHDPDGRVTIWEWKKISGPASFLITRLDSSTMIVRRLVQGIYQFELKVTDDKGAGAWDTLQVTVNSAGITNQPPVACIVQNEVITLPVNSVLLDGSCSGDPNNNITRFEWTKISGPSSFTFANVNGTQTQVSSLVEGVYLFRLQVTDAGGLSSMDTIQVLVNRQTNNPPVDIYISGEDDNGKAAYWKNGQVTRLSGSSESVARAIAVVGTDVYAAGEEGDIFMYGSNRAKYWKNGQEYYLTGPTGAGATSIAVNGSDVYVAGWEFSGSNTVARYWKNGQAFSLTDGSGEGVATCIVSAGGDVYIAGYDKGVAKYWKNGQPVSLTDGSLSAQAFSIAVSGNDVYVAGSEENGTVQVAKYWKNGQAVSLTNGSARSTTAISIAVDGTDVYVAGWEWDSGTGTGLVARYWKNGQTVLLNRRTTNAYTTSMAVFRGDIYVVGNEGTNVLRGKYWKNGQSMPLTPNAIWAVGIAVVPQ